jgi:hypothetical protein
VTILTPSSQEVHNARAGEKVMKTTPVNHHFITADHRGQPGWQPRPSLRDDLLGDDEHVALGLPMLREVDGTLAINGLKRVNGAQTPSSSQVSS